MEAGLPGCVGKFIYFLRSIKINRRIKFNMYKKIIELRREFNLSQSKLAKLVGNFIDRLKPSYPAERFYDKTDGDGDEWW